MTITSTIYLYPDQYADFRRFKAWLEGTTGHLRNQDCIPGLVSEGLRAWAERHPVTAVNSPLDAHPSGSHSHPVCQSANTTAPNGPQ